VTTLATAPTRAWILPSKADPRWPLAAFLALYVGLGHLLLSFNRAPLEIVVAIVACVVLDMLYTWVSTKKVLFPLSAIISGLGLAILFTAPGNGWLMLLCAWLTITSKYLVTWRGRHLFNPTNFALVLMLLLSGGQAAVAPAYQWGGHWQIVALVFALGLVLMSRVNKLPLVLSFWAVYALGALVRAQLTHMPAEITLWATVSGGAFVLFSFFMITDPKTSPASRNGQLAFGAGLGLFDLWLQLSFAVFSLFYALFLICLLRGLWWIFTDLRARSCSSDDSDGGPAALATERA
jgi:Na+-translocating ferredoxin:NAD+ oxidoreductase RnfD subunit